MSKKLSTPITSSSNNLTHKITNSLSKGSGIIYTGNKISSCGLNIPINPTDTNSVITFLSDAYIHGGYHVVKTNTDRDSIDCCYRKQGMKVIVVGEDLSFKEYYLESDTCDENTWREIVVNVDLDESEVRLIQDYTGIGTGLQTQMALNLAFKAAILQLGLNISEIEVPTKTSELSNNGEDGLNPFITAQDIPVITNIENTSELNNDGEDGVNPFITLADIPPSINVTNTSELVNDGENGIEPFITLSDIPTIVLPTKTSDLQNDGEGLDPFITLSEVPTQTPQVNSDWNAVSGPEEILNKPTIPVIIPQEQSDWNAVSGVSFIKNKPTIPAPFDISNKLDKPTTDGSWVVTRTAGVSGYADASTLGKNIFNANLVLTTDRSQNLGGYKLSFTNGRFSVPTLELEVTSANSVPNKIWTGGVGLWFTDSSGVQKRVMTGTVFTYNPTGDFTLSAVKTAMENAGYVFNDGHIIIQLGSNNYTCSIDIGSSNPNTIITIGKRGNGSISFNSTRTLNSGADSVTIMNGYEGSMVKIDFGTSTDFLTIRNL